MPALSNYFNDEDDPRKSNAPRHKFCDLMTISLLCALCGGETAVDMEHFGQMKEDFLREFLELPHGVPCHDRAIAFDLRSGQAVEGNVPNDVEKRFGRRCGFDGYAA
jgi:hypothetical protein